MWGNIRQDKFWLEEVDTNRNCATPAGTGET